MFNIENITFSKSFYFFRLSGNLAEIEMSAVKKDDEIMARDYLEHMLKTGSPEDRQESIGLIKSKFVLSDKKIELLRGVR